MTTRAPAVLRSNARIWRHKFIHILPMIEQKHLKLLSVVLFWQCLEFSDILRQTSVTVDVNCRDDADEKTNAAAPLLASQSHILEAGSNALSDLGGPPIFDQFFLLENCHFTPRCFDPQIAFGNSNGWEWCQIFGRAGHRYQGIKTSRQWWRRLGHLEIWWLVSCVWSVSSYNPVAAGKALLKLTVQWDTDPVKFHLVNNIRA